MLQVDEVFFEERPDPLITVAQGLAKGERGELAVQAMTEVGVDVILPWAAARSIVQWRGDRGVKAHAKWVSTAREAAKQARRAWVPDVPAQVTTKALAARVGETPCLVLHEEATESLSSVKLPESGGLLLVVGPEGGVTPEELDAFVAAGATPVRLGREVLRTSTAGVAAISALSVRLGRW
ncbi:hypothetical protein Afil01_41690 [Actinorhabdospora filicis]|uniref:Ribosomal RNA small subunit methyltransferase E n=1 Tax=Actinorhabdospora filicis TaxID=1785913 RepID=A0A9W6SNW8_9ACTN|nr:hypothetical protein Afil01_41690 [Actinorhabdospora filicis]